MSTSLIDDETGEIVTALVRPDSWSGATTRALEARKEREAIVKEILREGHDFGTVPGCGDKPALLKPGAEKIADALNLYPDYEELNAVQDFTNRVWFYRYRCRLKHRGSDVVMSTGIGSCNSEAAKYKYRDAQRVCPQCGKAAIIKGKEEYGGGWLCFNRKGGCGAKFIDSAPEIVNQQAGQIENPDIAALVNTVDKMAQKSAFVAACLNLGFSEQFTQDIEDAPPEAFNRDSRPPQTSAAPKDDVPNCPSCYGQMWDNRETKKGNQPDFKCKDRNCNKAVWLPKEALTEGFSEDQVLRDQLFQQAEKLMSLMPEDKRKDALGRLLMLETGNMAEKVNELAENARKKSNGDREAGVSAYIAAEESEREAMIREIRRDAQPDVIDKYLATHYNGKTLDRLALSDVTAIHEEFVLPF